MTGKKVVVAHEVGKKHPGKTDWEKVIKRNYSPVIDSENPELASNPNIKFVRPGKK